MSYLLSNSKLSSIDKLLAKYPRRGILLFKLLEGSQCDGSPLSKELQDLVIAYVSSLNEADPRILPVEEFDLELDAYEYGGQSKEIHNKTKTTGEFIPIMRFLKKLTLTPAQITEVDAEPIFAAGWCERDFLDLVCLCSVVNCINRLAVGVGLERKSEFRQRIFSKSPSNHRQEPLNIKLIFNH